MSSPPPPHVLARATTRKGSTHLVNDDRYALLDGRHHAVRGAQRGVIYAIADGVTSSGQGYLAAELACETLAEFFTTARPASEELIVDLVENADAQARLTTGAACTLAGVWVSGNKAWVFNLGDSAVLRLRRGKVSKLTPAQVRGRGLSAFVGMGPTVRHAIYLERVDVEDDDVFVLATDGLLQVVPQERIGEAFEIHPTPEAVLEFVQAELARSGHEDDATLVLVQVGDTERFPLLGLEPEDD
ncbi:MAG: protein phosphatase 2C domain-containing protein [Alphaproteobacteria bacterium]|nr:protein phosphatase 2C domain-containing protein [Alphaproteobacteria bacterium]